MGDLPEVSRFSLQFYRARDGWLMSAWLSGAERVGYLCRQPRRARDEQTHGQEQKQVSMLLPTVILCTPEL